MQRGSKVAGSSLTLTLTLTLALTLTLTLTLTSRWGLRGSGVGGLGRTSVALRRPGWSSGVGVCGVWWRVVVVRPLGRTFLQRTHQISIYLPIHLGAERGWRRLQAGLDSGGVAGSITLKLTLTPKPEPKPKHTPSLSPAPSSLSPHQEQSNPNLTLPQP